MPLVPHEILVWNGQSAFVPAQEETHQEATSILTRLSAS